MNKQVAKIEIEHDMPLTVKGVAYNDVLKMKRYLEHLKNHLSLNVLSIFSF